MDRADSTANSFQATKIENFFLNIDRFLHVYSSSLWASESDEWFRNVHHTMIMILYRSSWIGYHIELCVSGLF